MSALTEIKQENHWRIFDVEKHRTALLLAILFLGLALRLVFTYVLADELHYQHRTYEFNDTPSFTEGFINFWERGKYTHNIRHPEASFGRLPGYPVFYGVHYVLFGKDLSLPATALTQLFLDVLAIWLMYRIVKKITASEGWALAAALVYSTYPFIIYWVPYICTESLSCFITLAWLHQLCYFSGKKLEAFFIGIICVAAFFIREYLGILIVVTLASYLLWYGKSFKVLVVTSLASIAGFMIIYIGWPIRNYYQFEKIVLVRPTSAGYDNYGTDMAGYTLFYHCWSQDDNEWYDSLFTRNNNIFPQEAFTSEKDRILGEKLISKMKDCGTSYNNWIYSMPYRPRVNCNDEIYTGFVYLRDKFIKAHPFTYFIKVPARNLKKAFLKMKPEDSDEKLNWLYYTAFSYRSLLIILGFIGIIYLKEYRLLLPVFLFSGFMFLYICFYYRSLEMRYLLQADVLLIIPAVIILGKLMRKFLKPTAA